MHANANLLQLCRLYKKDVNDNYVKVDRELFMHEFRIITAESILKNFDGEVTI